MQTTELLLQVPRCCRTSQPALANSGCTPGLCRTLSARICLSSWPCTFAAFPPCRLSCRRPSTFVSPKGERTTIPRSVPARSGACGSGGTFDPVGSEVGQAKQQAPSTKSPRQGVPFNAAKTKETRGEGVSVHIYICQLICSALINQGRKTKDRKCTPRVFIWQCAI